MSINHILQKYIFINNDHNQIIQNIDFSKNSLLEVSKMINDTKYIDEYKNEDLHDYIFKFYACNEILASFKEKENGIISKEDLKIFTQYNDFINNFSQKIFSFILYNCLSEAKYADLLETKALNRFNDNYLEKIKKAYVEKLLEDSKKTPQDDIIKQLLFSFEEQTKNKNNETSKYSFLLQEYLTQYVEINYFAIEKEFKKSFDEVYSKEYTYQVREKLKNTIKPQFTSEKGVYNEEKFIRFNDFSKFIFSIAKTGYDPDNGVLQRKIIEEKMIVDSFIKDFSIEETFEFLSIIFTQCFRLKESYGGKPWFNIAQHALSFTKGEISAEIFIDQALSLEHNGGNMFNKNFIFNNNRQEKKYYFLVNNNSKLNLESITLNINNLILNLQSSSSVLSLCNFYDKTETWKSLTYHLNEDVQDTISSDLKGKNMYVLKANFDSFTYISQNFKSIPEIKELAKRVGYSMPQLNFNNYIISSKEKEEPGFFTYIKAEQLQINNLFVDIINGNYKNKTIKPFFKLHNLNYENNNNSKDLTKKVIGNKAHGLTNLINKGFNVPKALVFDTETCLSYLNNKKYFHAQYKNIDKKIYDYLIDHNKQPLLVSVRSGSSISMPGMMDSILNVGIDDRTYPELCKNYGKHMIDECAILFIHQFCKSKFGLNIELSDNLEHSLKEFSQILNKKNIPYNKEFLFPLSKQQQIKFSVEAVFDSWHSPRAIAWRNEKNIDHNMGTAATIQQMVFGNKNDKSFTCVIFSRDCITGKPDIMGEYLPKSQGEDLVSGKKTPLPISQLKISNPQIYQEIEYIAKTLEEEQKAIQDIEITVEDGKVYVLQMRNAVVSHEAQLTFAKDMGLNLLDVTQTRNLIGDSKVDTLLDADYNGLAASPGLISGIIVRNEEDIDKYKNKGKDLVFFANQALPEHAPFMIATQGFVTEFGGATSHAAILARSMGKPCVVGIGKQEVNNLESGSIVTIDANEGKIWKGQLPIVINQKKSISLANKILAANFININESQKISSLEFKIWTTKFNKFKILENPNKTHQNFLNLSQKVALILKKEYSKTNAIKITT